MDGSEDVDEESRRTTSESERRGGNLEYEALEPMAEPRRCCAELAASEARESRRRMTPGEKVTEGRVFVSGVLPRIRVGT